MDTCCGDYTGDVDSRTASLYGGPICKANCITPYTAQTSLYEEVNRGLREDNNLVRDAEFVWHCKQQMKELWHHGRRFEGEAYRFLKLDSSVVKTYHVGDKFLWPAFTSSSRKMLQGFEQGSNVLCQIDCDGEGVTYAVDVRHLSAFPSEDEVLLYPYSGFKVVDVDPYYKPGMTLIRLRVHDTFLVEKFHS